MMEWVDKLMNCSDFHGELFHSGECLSLSWQIEDNPLIKCVLSYKFASQKPYAQITSEIHQHIADKALWCVNQSIGVRKLLSDKVNCGGIEIVCTVTFRIRDIKKHAHCARFVLRMNQQKYSPQVDYVTTTNKIFNIN